MVLQELNHDFAICKLQSLDSVDLSKKFTFVSVTDDEFSLVCNASNIPANTVDIEYGWKGLKIEGILDFGMIGVISKISTLLAEEDISIFVISTFNTDYILLKSDCFDKAVNILCTNGYSVQRQAK